MHLSSPIKRYLLNAGTIKIGALGLLSLGLIACGGNSNGHHRSSVATTSSSSVAVSSSIVATSSSVAVSSLSSSSSEIVSSSSSSSVAPELTMLKTDGRFWATEDGTHINLKGTNIGNWLVQEFWMMGQGGNGVTDQCTLEDKLTERFGREEKEAAIKLFRDSWFTERDWDQIKAFGFNVVRLPIHWNVIEDELNHKTLRADAWHYIDWSIVEAKKRGIYVIIDLHGAAGGQTANDHTGCSGKNQYWTSLEAQDRTRWLWEQIANKYKDEPVVAAYDPLNEPWGSTPEAMATRVNELYDVIRAIDTKHIIMLPSHFGSIDVYGNPATKSQTNVAFEIHPYPGLFGDRPGDTAYAVHRDWLRCGAAGTGGVCDYQNKIIALNIPLLVGEFQPWQSAGVELGGQIGRATYDTYADKGWASTSWAYKLVSAAGGTGKGTWGMVTNAPNANNSTGLGKIVSANTWVCSGWDSTFANACDIKAGTINVGGTGPKTFYFVIKTGSTGNGNPDVTYDNISITNTVDSTEVIDNGTFESLNGWNLATISGAGDVDFNYSTAGKTPTGSTGTVLHIGRPNGATGEVNVAIYQQITLQGGQTYALNGLFKSNSSVETWAEMYLIDTVPVAGKDVLDMTGKVDFATASLADIKALFASFATQELEPHPGLSKWLTSATAPDIFNLPARPTNVVLVENVGSVALTWNPSTDPKVTGYKVSRSTSFGGTYTVLADSLFVGAFTDTTIVPGTTYFYKVTAVTATDESYASDVVNTTLAWVPVPAVLQAEAYTNMSGIQSEACSDIGGGLDIGYFEANDFIEFNINVATAGNFVIDYRLASDVGSDGFEVLVDGVVVATQAVEDTNGWQQWVTRTSPTIALSAGNHVVRIKAIDNEWNINWLEIKSI